MSAYPYKWKVLTFIFNAYALWLGQFTSQIKSLSKRRKERKMPDSSNVHSKENCELDKEYCKIHHTSNR